MSFLIMKSLLVVFFKSFETAVTTSELLILNSTAVLYVGWLPTRVISVPCNVVTTFTEIPFSFNICFAIYAAYA